MPVDPNPGYLPPFWLRNPHLQTLWPSLFRRIRGVTWIRTRLELPDGDFLDLDHWTGGFDRVVILSHGLEGNSRRPYIEGMARAFHRRGWDVIAWNFRGCSGEPNRLRRSYHSGATEDLAAVVDHAVKVHDYAAVAVVGFSLGGNLTLKYLAELGDQPGRVCGGAGISVPCDLEAAATRMAAPDCAFYMRRFLADMGEKMRAKARQFPGQIRVEALEGMTTFRQFDDAFTGPLHGFRDAQDYWDQCSCARWLDRVRIPVIVLNARDDPFLATACFPEATAGSSRWVHLAAPDHGGHVGFVTGMASGSEYWSEFRAAEFLGQFTGSSPRSG